MTRIVKRLDELEHGMVPDHIGWTLWQATLAWRREFVAGMAAAGHGWFAQARGNILVYIGPDGIRQGDLAEKAGLTKQAVQQFVDELVRDGIVQRSPDDSDARARRVRLTVKGQAAMQDADRIKVQIEEKWRARMGAEAFAALQTSLRRVLDAPG